MIFIPTPIVIDGHSLHTIYLSRWRRAGFYISLLSARTIGVQHGWNSNYDVGMLCTLRKY